METYRARRVLGADRSGSSWPVIVETDAGLFHTKLRGAAQAPASLVAETIVAALADTLELPVPTRALVDIPPGIPVDDAHGELAQLLKRSTGLNLGFALVPGARRFEPGQAQRVDLDLASRILWLDGLVQNPDRTVRNPNLLWSHDRLFLIDHGAALPFHHHWRAVTERSPRATSWNAETHVLRSRATRLEAADESLAPRLPRTALASVVDAVPDEWLADESPEARRRRRAAYVAFLWKRLKSPRPFVSREQSGQRALSAAGSRRDELLE